MNLLTAVLSHKKLTVAVLIMLLLAGFFGFVPVGRAMAKELCRIIISLFDDSYVIKNEYSQNEIVPYVEGTCVEYRTIGELKQASGKSGVIECTLLDYKLDSASYYRDSTEETVISIYLDKNGRSVELQQTFDLNTGYYGEKHSDEQWNTAYILDNVELNYYVYSTDNSYVGFASLDDSLLTVLAESEIDFLSFISNLE